MSKIYFFKKFICNDCIAYSYTGRLTLSLEEKNNGCFGFFVEKSEWFLTPWVKKSCCQFCDGFCLKWIRTLDFLLGTEGAQN